MQNLDSSKADDFEMDSSAVNAGLAQNIVQNVAQKTPHSVSQNLPQSAAPNYGVAPADCNPAYSLERAAQARPQRPVIYYEDTCYKAAEANLLTRQLAEFLYAQGLRPGERLCLVAANSPYHLFLHTACARLGAIFVPISPRSSLPELQAMWRAASPYLLVVDHLESAAGALDLVWEEYCRQASSVACVPVWEISTLAAAIQKYPGQLRSLLAAEISQSAQAAPAALNTLRYPQGAALIIFTSGTAGQPKAVELTHGQLWWAAQNFRAGFEYSPVDVELVAAPLTHIGGFNGTTLDIFSHGGTVVIVKEFSAGTVLKHLQRYRVNMMFGVPAMYSALLQHPDFPHTDLSAFRLPLIGGAAADPQLLQKLMAAGLPMLNVWGMTETGGAGCCLPADNLPQALGSIGQPFPYMEGCIVDPDTGQPSQSGELWLRGANIASSCRQDGSLTEAGWLPTGDLVKVDANGFLWVEGRLHNLINSGGEKIAPLEVEKVLARYPGVQECAVLGVADNRWGEQVAAALALEKDAEAPSLEEIQEFSAAYLARYKLPRRLKILSQLPKSPNGKIDYRALREVFKSSDSLPL